MTLPLSLGAYRLGTRLATPLAGFNAGFIICGIIMLAGGCIGMALIHPGREVLRLAGPPTAAAVGRA